MPYCSNCGANVQEENKFCAQCGEKILITEENDKQEQSYTYYQDQTKQNTYQTGSDEMFHPEDVKKNKGMGVLSYFGLLVLIPLLAGDQKSDYVRFHTNQGLVLWLISVILDVAEKVVNFIVYDIFKLYGFDVFSGLFDIVDFALFIFVILGIISACKGQKKELVFVGKIHILK